MLWIDKPEVLWDIDNLKYFVPASGMTWEEQANATIRFIFYLSLILYLYYDNPLLLFIPLGLTMGLQYYCHKKGKLQTGVENFLFSMEHYEDFEDHDLLPSTMYEEENKFPEYDGHNFKVNPNNKEEFDLEDEKKNEQINNLMKDQMGDKNPMVQMNGSMREPLLESDKPEFKPMEIEAKASTEDNPFANSMPFDTVARQILPATPNEYSKDENFYKKLFNNVNDLFDRNNSQRQFTTNPSTTRINDREAFMQFCYNTPYSEE